MFEKINQLKQLFTTYEKELFIGLLVILSSSLSFGLGRLTKLEESRAPVTITKATSTQGSIKVVDDLAVNLDNRIVASKNGKKYYLPWCSSKAIKPENKIYFQTASAAEAAGLTRAANCNPKP
jgi:hypothetical protein